MGHPRLQFNVLSIDFMRVTNCFYDYIYMNLYPSKADYDILFLCTVLEVVLYFD